MPIDFVQDWVKNNAIRNRVEDVQNPGEFNATTWDRIVGGLTGANVDKAVDDQTQKINNKEVTDYLTSIGETRQSLGIPENANVNQASGAYTALTRTRGETKSQTEFDRGMAPIIAQNAITNKRLDNDMAIRLQEMAANRDSQASQLEYQKMRDRRADKEYNERMERLDRKDRQAMMQNLAAGLASLGAAFAL